MIQKRQELHHNDRGYLARGVDPEVSVIQPCPSQAAGRTPTIHGLGVDRESQTELVEPAQEFLYPSNDCCGTTLLNSGGNESSPIWFFSIIAIVSGRRIRPLPDWPPSRIILMNFT